MTTKHNVKKKCLQLELNEVPLRHGLHNNLDTVGAMKTRDDPLPQIFLAVLGATDRLQHVIELLHATWHHAERITCTAHNAHKVIVVGRRDVVQAGLCTHAEPTHISILSASVYNCCMLPHYHRYTQIYAEVL